MSKSGHESHRRDRLYHRLCTPYYREQPFEGVLLSQPFITRVPAADDSVGVS
jgi:hypothetical protein